GYNPWSDRVQPRNLGDSPGNFPVSSCAVFDRWCMMVSSPRRKQRNERGSHDDHEDRKHDDRPGIDDRHRRDYVRSLVRPAVRRTVPLELTGFGDGRLTAKVPMSDQDRNGLERDGEL